MSQPQAGQPSSAIVARGAEDTVDRVVHPSGIVPTLQNVVATVNLGCKLDLKEIALHARNAEYNPKRFAAVIMRIRDPKTTALIFASGKMVCTGAKSEQDSRLAAKKYCRIIQRLGFKDAEFKEFKIQNIVGSCDVKFPIRLEGLFYAHGYFATYEPELFPGLIYRMKQPKIVLLIFVSGKVVLTGAKKREEIYRAFENIYPTLTEFRKNDGAVAVGPGAQVAGNAGGAPAAAVAAGPVAALMAAPPARPAAAARAGPMLPPSARPNATNLPPPSPAHHQQGGSHVPPPTPGYQGLPPATPAWNMPITHTPYVPPTLDNEPGSSSGFKAAAMLPQLPPKSG